LLARFPRRPSSKADITSQILAASADRRTGAMQTIAAANYRVAAQLRRDIAQLFKADTFCPGVDRLSDRKVSVSRNRLKG